MNELIGVVDWSRALFALTAMYHWLFVPLTIGLSVIVAIMESIYLRTHDDKWLAATKFWMTLFGINFACGVATGIILEFEFGTNWSNYSWFVGDIFGVPLAIEGIVAFSTTPLVISSVFGLICCALALVMILVVIVRTLVFGDPTSGWPSLVCIMLLLSGIQMLGIGILGQYLAKTYLETKKRPIYLVRQTNIEKT